MPDRVLILKQRVDEQSSCRIVVRGEMINSISDFYNFRGSFGEPFRIYLPTPRQLVSRPYNNIITNTRASSCSHRPLARSHTLQFDILSFLLSLSLPFSRLSIVHSRTSAIVSFFYLFFLLFYYLFNIRSLIVVVISSLFNPLISSFVICSTYFSLNSFLRLPRATIFARESARETWRKCENLGR